MPRPKPLDLALIALVLLSALGLFCLTLPGGTGATAVILVRGEQVAAYPLTGPVREVEAGPCRFRIGEGGAEFLSSDCPDQVCVRTGVLTRAGQSAACLPNQTVLVIRGAGEVDAVAG